MPIEELNKLKELDFNKQLIFAYLACERLYPNYVYFSVNYNFGNPSILRQAIDYLYENIFEKETDENKTNSLIKKIEPNTPNPGDFPTVLASSALDACTAILASLDFLTNKQFSRIIDISNNAIETADMYIHYVDKLDLIKDKDFQHKVNSHPLMKKEVANQSGIIAFMLNTKNIDYDDIQTLLLLQKNNERGSLSL